MTLLADVVRVLGRERIPHALIGAGALAIHGVSRATADTDLLTLDGSVLEPALWVEQEQRGVELRVFRGDADDPLAGSVRLVEGSEIVDVVVGRFGWQEEIIGAATTTSVGALSLPVAHPAGLILLKLHAGGSRDAWDVQSLLETLESRSAVEAEVERSVSRLPVSAQRLWHRLRSEA